MLSHEKACAVPLLTVRELSARRTDETREDPIFYFTMLMQALGEPVAANAKSEARRAPRRCAGRRTSGRCTLICVTSPKSPGANAQRSFPWKTASNVTTCVVESLMKGGEIGMIRLPFDGTNSIGTLVLGRGMAFPSSYRAFTLRLISPILRAATASGELRLCVKKEEVQLAPHPGPVGRRADRKRLAAGSSSFYHKTFPLLYVFLARVEIR